MAEAGVGSGVGAHTPTPISTYGRGRAGAHMRAGVGAHINQIYPRDQDRWL